MPGNQSAFSECPNCGEMAVSFHSTNQTLTTKHGSEVVELIARVPKGVCGSCEFSFTDHRAEKARHIAVCRHFGLLTPDEVGDIRATYNMTRSDFAELTGIGEASLARWERGEVLQNKAMDQFLRLVSHRDNFMRLRAGSAPAVISNTNILAASEREFPNVPDIRGAIRDSQQFQLRPTGT
jgi:putative zinc finger/helix-turn-helix YgiT family protein